MRPARIDLADLIWPEALPVTFWNAWFVPRVLQGVDGLGNDLMIDRDDPPITFAPLAEEVIRIGVSPASRAVLETNVTFTFDSGEVVIVLATIHRVVVWGFPPDWADGVHERLVWATDILASETLVEQRRALRPAPRREFDAAFLAHGQARQFLDLALFAWGANAWMIPVWPDVQWLDHPVARNAMNIACRTDGFEFRAGEMAILLGETPLDAEAVEIETVTADGLALKRIVQHDWPSGARLYPALPARLQGEVSLNRQTYALATFDASFIVTQTTDVSPAAPAAMYRGRPVLEMRPDETETLTRSYARLIETLDSGLAAAAQVTNVG